jgi:hypothetical protein
VNRRRKVRAAASVGRRSPFARKHSPERVRRGTVVWHCEHEPIPVGAARTGLDLIRHA